MGGGGRNRQSSGSPDGRHAVSGRDGGIGLTESGILKIYKKSGEEIKGEILEHVSVKDACFLQMDCSGFLGWSSGTGKTEVELSPDVSLFTVSVPEDVYLTRAEVQIYIGNEMIQAQNLLETEKTSGAEGDTAWMEGTDSIYTASWNMKLSPETGDRIDLRIVAETPMEPSIRLLRPEGLCRRKTAFFLSQRSF